ncbi:hypothetical protein MNBD_NITROSPINAE05-392, partial [hydrothermal vent metagenome]
MIFFYHLELFEIEIFPGRHSLKRLVYIFNMFYLFSLSLWVAGMFLLGILVEIMVRITLRDEPLM